MALRSENTPDTWVVAPRGVRRLRKKLPHGRRTEWCYLGSDVTLSEKVSRHMAPARRVFIGDELRNIATALKEPFSDWMAEIGRQQDEVNWWASRLASKSPLQTDFFVLVCYSRLADLWICGPREETIRILVVEDPWLRWVLRRQFAKITEVSFYGHHWSGCVAQVIYGGARIPAAMGLMFVTSMWAVVRSRLLRFRQPLDGSRMPAVLIYTWIGEKSFSVQNKIQDSHTGRLEEIFLKRGEFVRRLIPLDIPTTFLKRFKSFSSSLIITSRYVRVLDLVLSLCRFRIKGLTRLAMFQGWDCSPLLYRELLFEWGSTSFPRYCLWYRAMLRVAAEIGPKVKCLIYPFENQPWEKLMCLAWRERAPHVRLIGYQHSRVPPLLLPYTLSKKEVEILPLPDRIVANGEWALELLKSGGFPGSKLTNGGALRYEYFYDIRNGSAPAALREVGFQKKQKAVLVTFPLSPPQCKSLLVDLLVEFNEPLFPEDIEREPVRLVLKCHPWLPLEMFYRGKVSLPPWITFTEESLEKELARADLLLYVPSTTAWREACIAGVPVLKYEVDLLDLDPPESFTNGCTVYRCRKETVRSSIKEVLRKPSEKIHPDFALLERMFGRVDEDLWMRIVSDRAEYSQRPLSGSGQAGIIQ